MTEQQNIPSRDVTVDAVAPGPIATALFLDGKDEQTIERMAKMNPLERLDTPATWCPSSPALDAGSTVKPST